MVCLLHSTQHAAHRVGSAAVASLILASNLALLEKHSSLACGQIFPYCVAGQFVWRCSMNDMLMTSNLKVCGCLLASG